MSNTNLYVSHWALRLTHAIWMTCLLCPIAPALADGSAVSLHASPEGGGIAYTTSYSDNLQARFGYHQYTRSGTYLSDLLVRVTSFGVITTYHHNVTQQVVSAIADYYYTDSHESRLSIGLMHNNSNDNIVASKSSLGGYTINNVYYASNQVSKLTGTIKYNSVMPYIGLGWGNPLSSQKKWGLMLDIGVMYQGKPEVTLNAIGAAPTLNADMIAEQNSIKNQSPEWAPLAAIGAFYRW